MNLTNMIGSFLESTGTGDVLISVIEHDVLGFYIRVSSPDSLDFSKDGDLIENHEGMSDDDESFVNIDAMHYQTEEHAKAFFDWMLINRNKSFLNTVYPFKMERAYCGQMAINYP